MAAAATSAWLRALELTSSIVHQPTRILSAVIADMASACPEAPALLSDEECFTFGALAGRANRYARWALANGLAKGSVICLFMPNRPEYMAVWLGVASVGGVVALVNTSLRGALLARCIDAVAPAHIIVAGELAEQFASARPLLAGKPQLWMHGLDGDAHPDLAREIGTFSAEPPALDASASPTISDPALLIYTSGTQGLPKAAYISHARLMTWSFWFAGMMDVQRSDRMYNCLPMYHSIGGVVAAGAMLVKGASVAIARNFSAHRFWHDVASWDCSLFQYIGELCRFIVRSPPDPRERSHRLRLCCGNGLREDVWHELKRRFGIPHILEFYAATEGVISLFNCEEKPGSIGRLPPFLNHRSPIALVRCESENGDLVRDQDGRCIRCLPNQVGEVIGKILDARSGIGPRFEGYSNAARSEEKLARNVFEPGDVWFRSGDLMRRDESGFFYFVDRLGENFRWKGENVSTLEVAQTITGFPDILDASVYGVPVPGVEGRAGMAALVVKDGFDLARFHAHLLSELPDYACPLFLRVRQAIEITPSFKHIKTELLREGYDPRIVADPLFFRDLSRAAYVPLDDDLHNAIKARRLRI
jgi:fatty-acyl-CoA synthase